MGVPIYGWKPANWPRVKYADCLAVVHDWKQHAHSIISRFVTGRLGRNNHRNFEHLLSCVNLLAGSGVRRARTKAFFIEEKQRELIKPNLFSAYLLAYAELDKTTIDARNWGYKNQILYPVIKDKMLHTNLFRLKNDLTFWNPNTRERVVHNPILTVEEAKAEAERLGLDKQPEVKLAKHAQIEFVFRNDNEMPINNVRINIDEVRDGKPVYSILRAQRPISEIPSKQRFPRVPVDVYLGLDDPFPSRTHYRITIDYDLMGKPQPSRQIMTHYEASSDRWVWEG